MNPEPDNSVLAVRDLHKTFPSPGGGRVEVLRGVTLAVGAGEMLAVVAAALTCPRPMLHVCGGLDVADAGSVRIGEVELTKADAAKSARVRNEVIGFVFQSHHLLPDLAAWENVALPLWVARVRRGAARAAAHEMLAAVGLVARAAHRAGELSGGEQQRVALARALVSGPRLVLADEPTGNLDARTGEEIARLLAYLCRERRAAVVVATHNESLARACDRVLELRDGRATDRVG